MPRRRGNGGGRRSSRRVGSPVLYTSDLVPVTTADTVVNTTVLTMADKVRQFVRVKSLQISANAGASQSRVYYVLRRVPDGYTPPTITLTSGTTAIVDDADVIGYGILNQNATNTNPTYQPVLRMSRRKNGAVLFNGDTLVLQAVADVSSTGQAISFILDMEVFQLQ